jgi:hypothetical protein
MAMAMAGFSAGAAGAPAPADGETDADVDVEAGLDEAPAPDDAAAVPEPEPEPAPEPAPEPEPEAPEPEPAPATVAEPEAKRGGLWAVRVQLSGGAPGELELFRIDPTGTTESAGTIGGVPYTRVCRDPCDDRVEVNPHDEFFVAGARLMPSKTFALEGASEVELRVRPGPKPIRFAGFGLTVSGALLIPAGGLLVGAVDRGKGPDIAGFTLIGVGVVALAVGIGLLVRGRTLVNVR